MVQIRKSRVWFEIGYTCNLSCCFCYHLNKINFSSVEYKNSTKETLRVLTRLFTETDVETIAFSGGEPLLCPDILSILAYVRHYKTSVILTTNGTLLNDEKIRACIRLGVKTFQIPLHSDNQETHDCLTNGASWEKTIRAIALIREFGGDAVIVFVATSLNLFSFKNVVEIAAIFGIKRVIFNRFIPGPGVSEIYKEKLAILDEEKLKLALSEADDVACQYGLKIALGTPIALSDEEQHKLVSVETCSCSFGMQQNRFVLDMKGNVRWCPQSTLFIGNILKDHLSTIMDRSSTYSRSEQKINHINNCVLI